MTDRTPTTEAGRRALGWISDDLILAIEDEARAPLVAALTSAISVLENYGDHHEWCARADGSAEPCNCGLWNEMERLNALSREDRP